MKKYNTIFMSDGRGGVTEANKHIKDLTGMQFHKLTVLGLEKVESRKTFWRCRCSCGNIIIARGANLVAGNTKSCGCLRHEERPSRRKHGYSHKERLYNIWKHMRTRCNNANTKDYQNYGGRGIRVCDEWNEYLPFREWALSHGYNEHLTIDRIDNDGDYCPENCRWATNTTQVRNRRKTVKLSYNGETRALTEWCEIFGLNIKTCYNRLHNYGWTNPRDILFGKGGTEECRRIYSHQVG